MRTGGQQVPSYFENSDRLFPVHGGEVVEELVEAIAGRQIVEKVLHRHPRPDEDRGTTENLGVAVNDRLKGRHVFPPDHGTPDRDGA